MSDYDFMKLYNSRHMLNDYAMLYDLVELRAMVEDPEKVAQASSKEARALYTYCIRQDKWEGRINIKQLDRVLDRLHSLGQNVEAERWAAHNENLREEG